MPRVLLTDQEKRERKNIIDKKYYEKNKKKILEKGKEWYQKNKQKRSEKGKKYNKTEKGKKVKTISSWKLRGLKCEDYDSLYCHFINSENCDECGIIYGEKGDGTGSFKCMDHDHQTGLFRNFLCQQCNLKRG